MTIFQAPLAQPEPVRVKLSATTVTTIITAQQYKQAIGKIRVVNETGGAVTANVDIYNGTTAYSLTGTVSIPANSSIEIYDEVLNVNELLRVTAGTANTLVVHATFALGAQR
jgi:hypothetical protein